MGELCDIFSFRNEFKLWSVLNIYHWCAPNSTMRYVTVCVTRLYFINISKSWLDAYFANVDKLYSKHDIYLHSLKSVGLKYMYIRINAFKLKQIQEIYLAIPMCVFKHLYHGNQIDIHMNIYMYIMCRVCFLKYEVIYDIQFHMYNHMLSAVWRKRHATVSVQRSRFIRVVIYYAEPRLYGNEYDDSSLSK